MARGKNYYRTPAFFYKMAPTVPPLPTPKLTKREDSAAVLLIFFRSVCCTRTQMSADENTLPILPAVSTCMCEA